MSDESVCSEDHNPSPPPELLEAGEDIQNADKIGDTVFSKQWVCQTLMKLIQDVEKAPEREEETEEGEEDSCAGYEVEEDLQNELCQLWDMSANPDVAQFLQDYKAIDILAAIITKSKAPRATEICVGILGNLACKDDICREMTEKEGFIEVILYLLENPDAPTLVETTRLIFACISSESEASSKWTEAIRQAETVYKSLVFIISSSTNTDLLKNAGELLDKLLDTSDDLLNDWSTEELVAAILETFNQLGPDNTDDTLHTYLHIFQLISTCENGVEALALHLEPAYRALTSYLTHQCLEDEIMGLSGREGPLAATISVLHVLVTSPQHGVVLQDQDMIRCLLKILEALYPRLRTERQSSREQQATDDHHGNAEQSNHSNGRRRDDSTSSNNAMEAASTDSTQQQPENSTVENTNLNSSRSNEESHVTSGLLFGIIQGVLVDIVELVSVEAAKKSPPSECPKLIHYVSEYCPRSRIHALLLCLKSADNIETESPRTETETHRRESDQNESKLTRTLLEVAKSFELNRLEEVIEDFTRPRRRKKATSTSSDR